MASIQTLVSAEAARLCWPEHAPDAVWIFGPTASGKSALALSIAASRPAVIINADASQLYAPLRILTARPNAQEEAQAPHRLYGQLNANDACSAAQWVAWLAPEIAQAQAHGLLPIVVGGTGLYLAAALQGLSPMPAIPAQLRTQLQQECAHGGLAPLLAELQTRDPVLAAQLKAGDTQRILRALEVVRHTGTPLSDWQKQPRVSPLPPLRWHGVRVLPNREWIRDRIAQRAQQMWNGGAIEEVAALRSAGIAPDAPVCRAIGVAEILAYLNGTLDAASAREQLIIATQQYAKRQATWARHQLAPEALGATNLE